MPDKFLYNDVESATPQESLSDAARNNLQCNILTSTRRYYSKQLFVRFENKADFQRWLLALPQVTSASEQGRGSKDVNLLFSYAGLAKLELAEADLKQMDRSFRCGARSEPTRKRLRDAPPDAAWGKHAQGWDAALLVHSSTDDPLPAELLALPEDSLVEEGNSLDRNRHVVTDATEKEGRFNVFGYKDGISTNVYEGPIPPFDSYDPRRKLSTLLTRDPCADGAAFGSYFVFRKYEQDVDTFRGRVEEIAHAIEVRRKDERQTLVPLEERYTNFAGLVGDALREEIKSWLMGRSTEGVPLGRTTANDYTLRDDPKAVRCPFHAHTAKMNPRGRTGDDAAEAELSIARRGISYGHGESKPQGSLFWCAQASIDGQFERLLEEGANDQNVDVGSDPNPDFDDVVGRAPVEGPFEVVSDPYPDIPRYQRWKSTIDIDFSVWSAISLRGAEYFFAPSALGIAALKASAEEAVKS
jgi:deferrochelatase/peroxidase EfeB